VATSGAGDEGAAEEAFAAACDGLFAAMRSARGRVVADDEMSLAHARMLEPLVDGAEMTVSALAAHAGVAVPTATRMLRGLEQRGMVVRERPAHNERVVMIVLTQAGRDAIALQRQRLREIQRGTFRSLSPDEQAVAADLITKITALVNRL
jgi:MarR family transcriptional regulator, organic hydroperoxide resistance regulator